MPFINAPGIPGQLYIPEETPGGRRKHNCMDCTVCMVCNDGKCDMCLKQQTCGTNAGANTDSASH